MRYRLMLAAAVAAAYVSLSAAAPPKLAVILVVDQMRADYVDRFQDDWSAGLKRLVTRGAWFTRAAYPYLNTFTCAGHATISTGTLPSTHGIAQNVWFDRGRKTMVTCTQDATVRTVPYGTSDASPDGPASLLAPTFGDEMRAQRSARVVSLSLKARSAIMLAGHGGDAVTWLSDALSGWETSTAFATSPVPEVAAFVAANPIEADYGKTWDRLLPADRYREPDAGVGEAAPSGWAPTFPHALRGGAGKVPDAMYYAQWEQSPFADAYLGRMAAALADSMQLGRHDTTDVLAVSFSSPDLVGHGFGPKSQEVHDIYAHLDRTIGKLLDDLDRLVGPDAYVVALSADHGVTAIPEQLQAEGHDGGRLDAMGIASAVELAVRSALGPGTYVSRLNGNDVYLAPGVFDRLSATPRALAAVVKAVETRPGVARAFHRTELAAGASSKDALLRAAALSYVADRSGDIVYAPRAGWMIGTTGTTHGSANADDQRVPIVLYGAGIRPGRYGTAATPADIAPTLAAICGITMPRATGTPLRPALLPVPDIRTTLPR